MERWIFSALLLVGLAASPGLASAPPSPSSSRDATSSAKVDSTPVVVSPAVATASTKPTGTEPRTRTAPDPAARLLEGSDASEYWTLFIELESGHRITQRFLLTNAGPGDHTAVAVGHLSEPGREPYRYENGRRRSRWTLSPDRLFFDIAASHLDMHRPRGELRISKQDVEIQLFFDFDADAPAMSVPRERLPGGYSIDVLAAGAETVGTLRAPWMTQPIETRGRTWLVHTWTRKAEAEIVQRRVEIYGNDAQRAIYGLQIRGPGDFDQSWMWVRSSSGEIIESGINIPARWTETRRPTTQTGTSPYALPGDFSFSGGNHSGQIALEYEWLRFDPLSVIPQPFRWFIRRSTQPQEVWAEARIDVTLSPAPDAPSLPIAGKRESEISSNSNRETEDETAERSVTGVASITFLNPTERR